MTDVMGTRENLIRWHRGESDRASVKLASLLVTQAATDDPEASEQLSNEIEIWRGRLSDSLEEIRRLKCGLHSAIQQNHGDKVPEHNTGNHADY